MDQSRGPFLAGNAIRRHAPHLTPSTRAGAIGSGGKPAGPGVVISTGFEPDVGQGRGRGKGGVWGGVAPQPIELAGERPLALHEPGGGPLLPRLERRKIEAQLPLADPEAPLARGA